MKNIFASLILLLLCLVSRAQFPNNTSQSNLQTKVNYLGALGATYGFLPGDQTDTTTLNTNLYAKGIAGIIERTGNLVWMRNTTANAWLGPFKTKSNEGLTDSANYTQLGQAFNASGDPGGVYRNTEIPLNGYQFRLRGNSTTNFFLYNQSDNNGIFRFQDHGLLETIIYGETFDYGWGKIRVHNSYDSAGVGVNYASAASGIDITQSKGSGRLIIYQGFPDNSFINDGAMLWSLGPAGLRLTANAGPITFTTGQTGGGEYARFTASRMGIGTTTPGQKLSVTGSFSTSDSVLHPNLLRITDTTGFDVALLNRTTGNIKKMYPNVFAGFVPVPTWESVLNTSGGSDLLSSHTIQAGSDFDLTFQHLVNINLLADDDNGDQQTYLRLKGDFDNNAGVFLGTQKSGDSTFLRMDHEDMYLQLGDDGHMRIIGLEGSHNADDSVLVINPTTKIVGYRPYADITIPINNLLAATGSNTTNNGDFTQQWQSSSLSDKSLFWIRVNSADAASNAQTGLTVSSTGANTNSSQTTYAARFSNGHTGTSSTNVSATFSSTAGSINYAAQFLRGIVSFGTVATETGTLQLNGGTSGTVTVKPLDAAGTWTFRLPNSGGTNNFVFKTDGSGNTDWVDVNTLVTPFALTNGSGTTANSTAVDIGGTLTADADIDGNFRFRLGKTISLSGFEVTVAASDISLHTNQSFLIDDASRSAASNGYVWTLSDQSSGKGEWQAAAGGASTWNGITDPTGTQSLTFDDAELTAWTMNSNTETFWTITSNSLTTGIVESSVTSSLTTGTLLNLASTSTALAANNELLNIAMSGANASNAITATGARISVTNTNGTSGTNIAIDATASGATTDNWAVNATGNIKVTSANAAQVTTSSAFTTIANSLTTGTAHYLQSSSLTTGKMIDIAVTGTAGLTNQVGVNVSMSGANGTGAQTTYGGIFSNTHTGTSVNVGAEFIASGGSTNTAIRVASGNGRVALGQLNGNATLDVVGGTISDSYATHSSGGSANFATATGLAITSNTTATLLYLGAAGVDFRMSLNGTTSSTITANRPYSTELIGASAVTETGTGTIPLISSLVLLPPTITGGAATVTKTATLYIDAPPSATVVDANYASYIRTGNSWSGGKHMFDNTITTGGTTGNQTIDKPTGTVNIAATGTTVTVTNNFCTTSSIVYAVIRTNDATATGIKNIVPGAGSFVITLNAAATAEVSVGFIVFN